MPDLTKFDSERLCKYHETLLEKLIEMPDRSIEIEKRRSEIIDELARSSTTTKTYDKCVLFRHI